ncbi:cytochrome P450 monooxygenase ATR2 [Colletotrichum spaethianum]|uniref:Cytochrome P450 monooxygenase ATR2 n=1 Tax=Colletotrichum spaethianum TaxID=700344 RepID=A0AA37P9R1_9PEZI|nr:cytochrome P450 monooxygenase ATR2 [Colletotrichum spaethianum]GKT48263.1 cytochrome P450 monooxygenase ATR2 [Colletotrichum spaethianum]
MNATARLAVDSTLLAEAAYRWPVVATTLLACAFALVLQTAFKTTHLADLPLVGAEYGGKESRRKKFMNGEAKNLYLDGYKKRNVLTIHSVKFKERAFRITTARKSTNIVVAPKFMDELKRLPDDVLSFNKALEEVRAHDCIGWLNAVISEEVVEAMRIELPQSCEWTEVKILDKLMRIVGMVSGRVFIGPELCRNDTYLEASVNYTVDFMSAVRKVASIPPYLRPILASRTSEVKRVRKRIAEAGTFLNPVVTARREAAANPDYQKPDDVLQWLLESQEKFGQKDDTYLAKCELSLSFAAIHTTSTTTTNALYTLSAMPEFVAVLREDVQQALAETNGVFTSIAMQNMKKLDSFLKECMRHYALGPVSFQRQVLKTFTLSNGQVIPAGTVIEVPSIGIYTDEAFFPDADKFDPLRFYKLRQAKKEQKTGSKQAEVVANSQFISVGQTSLTFGYGRHACPGRFFAVNEIKMIMANLLLNYDFMNVGGSRERYPNLESGAMSYPDPNRVILLKKL